MTRYVKIRQSVFKELIGDTRKIQCMNDCGARFSMTFLVKCDPRRAKWLRWSCRVVVFIIHHMTSRTTCCLLYQCRPKYHKKLWATIDSEKNPIVICPFYRLFIARIWCVTLCLLTRCRRLCNGKNTIKINYVVKLFLYVLYMRAERTWQARAMGFKFYF